MSPGLDLARSRDNVNQLAANLTTQVRAIAVSTAVTKGDLTRSIAVQASGEVAALKDNINEIIRNLKDQTLKNEAFQQADGTTSRMQEPALGLIISGGIAVARRGAARSKNQGSSTFTCFFLRGYRAPKLCANLKHCWSTMCCSTRSHRKLTDQPRFHGRPRTDRRGRPDLRRPDRWAGPSVGRRLCSSTAGACNPALDEAGADAPDPPWSPTSTAASLILCTTRTRASRYTSFRGRGHGTAVAEGRVLFRRAVRLRADDSSRALSIHSASVKISNLANFDPDQLMIVDALVTAWYLGDESSGGECRRHFHGSHHVFRGRVRWSKEN